MSRSNAHRSGRLRVALIGATDHANHFVPLINTFQPVDVVGVWDYSTKTAQEFARVNGIERVLERPEDALDYAEAAVVPMHGRPPREGERWGDAPSDHLRLSRIFLEAGKAVFVTRPLTTSVRDAEKMLDLAVENDAPIMSCSALRYDKRIRQLRGRVEDGDLGKLRTCFPTVRTKFPDRQVTISFYGAHAVEMGYAVFGTGAEWVQTTTTVREPRGPRSNVFVVKYGDGRILFGQLLDGCPTGGYGVSVHGEKGEAEARPDTFYAGHPYKPWIKETIGNPKDNYFITMFREFVQMARTREPAIPYTELLEIAKVLAAAEKSARTGRRVYLEDL